MLSNHNLVAAGFQTRFFLFFSSISPLFFIAAKLFFVHSLPFSPILSQSPSLYISIASSLVCILIVDHFLINFDPSDFDLIDCDRSWMQMH